MLERIGPMKCEICGREWIAAMEDSATERLECPSCGAMVQAPPQEDDETGAISSD